MKALIKVAIFSFILASFVSSCGQANGADASGSGEKAEATSDPDAKFYSFTLEPATLAAGAETAVSVTLHPAEGYKWNDEYPAAFVLTGGEGLTIGKTEFKAKKKDFVMTGKQAAFTFPVTAASSGAFTLTLQGGFSICNDTSCKIFRKKTIDLKIEAN
ncbi:MAG: hypothetical protein ABIK09_05150 [Pseudomonadota bacterium]